MEQDFYKIATGSATHSTGAVCDVDNLDGSADVVDGVVGGTTDTNCDGFRVGPCNGTMVGTGHSDGDATDSNEFTLAIEDAASNEASAGELDGVVDGTSNNNNGGLVCQCLLLKLRNLIKEYKDKRVGVYNSILVGCDVETTSQKMCQLSKHVVRKRCKRVKRFGNVIKEPNQL